MVFAQILDNDFSFSFVDKDTTKIVIADISHKNWFLTNGQEAAFHGCNLEQTMRS